MAVFALFGLEGPAPCTEVLAGFVCVLIKGSVGTGTRLGTPQELEGASLTKKVPNPIDVHVGSRVRLRRMLVGMSQEKLGEMLGLTFQQIQKYEKGANRIGASRLYQIAQILGVPVQFFFDDIPQEHSLSGQSGMAEPDSAPFVMDFVSSAEGLQLNRSYTRISDAQVRKRLLELVKSLSGDTPVAASNDR